MLKYLSLFSGIGAPEKALKNLGIEYELIGFSEIDKYAIKSYCAIHNVSEELNLGDITKIDIKSLPKDIDFITHGSPCTDLSLAGKEAGADKGSGTRSSLMWNSVEIFKHCKPKIILWENVKNLLSKKHKHNFDAYIEDLNNLGYTSYYKVLNAKDFGIPQNRERVFTISIRNDINKEFKFPEPFDNGIRLKDLLEKEVDEKYYINTEKANKLIEEFKANNKNNEQKILVCGKLNSSQDGIVCNPNGISPTHVAGHGNCPKVVCPCITPDRLNKRQNGRRFKTNGEPMFTLTAQDRHGILETNTLNFIGGIGEKDIVGDNKSLSRNYPQGNRVYDSNNIACSQTANGGGIGGPTGLYLVDKSKRIGGLFDDEKSKHQAGSVWDVEGLAPTLDTMQGGYRQPCVLTEGENKTVVEKYRIRKLTPKECWRLMGFKDEQFLKAEQVCSNSQLYKQAGNSIVVNVMEEIFKNLI